MRAPKNSNYRSRRTIRQAISRKERVISLEWTCLSRISWVNPCRSNRFQWTLTSQLTLKSPESIVQTSQTPLNRFLTFRPLRKNIRRREPARQMTIPWPYLRLVPCRLSRPYGRMDAKVTHNQTAEGSLALSGSPKSKRI